MNCQEFEELSGAYILGAVTSEERRTVEEHLAHCTKCQHLARELQSVVNVLPLAAPSAAPSLELKERIFSDIRAMQADLPRAVADRRKRHVAKTVRSLRWWSERITGTVAAAMLVLLVIMVSWNNVLQQQLARSTQLAAMTTSRQYAIEGTATLPEAHGQLIYFPHENVTMLVIHGLPQPKGAHVYQGWLMHDGRPFSMGLLNVKDSVATGGFFGDLKGFDAAAVSLEPGPQPSLNVPQGGVVAQGMLEQPLPGP